MIFTIIVSLILKYKVLKCVNLLILWKDIYRCRRCTLLHSYESYRKIIWQEHNIIIDNFQIK